MQQNAKLFLTSRYTTVTHILIYKLHYDSTSHHKKTPVSKGENSYKPGVTKVKELSCMQRELVQSSKSPTPSIDMSEQTSRWERSRTDTSPNGIFSFTRLCNLCMQNFKKTTNLNKHAYHSSTRYATNIQVK